MPTIGMVRETNGVCSSVSKAKYWCYENRQSSPCNTWRRGMHLSSIFHIFLLYFPWKKTAVIFNQILHIKGQYFPFWSANWSWFCFCFWAGCEKSETSSQISWGRMGCEAYEFHNSCKSIIIWRINSRAATVSSIICGCLLIPFLAPHDLGISLHFTVYQFIYKS